MVEDATTIYVVQNAENILLIGMLVEYTIKSSKNSKNCSPVVGHKTGDGGGKVFQHRCCERLPFRHHSSQKLNKEL